MTNQDPKESLIEYINQQFEEFWTVEMWLHGHLCLRCNPKGMFTHKNEGQNPFCIVCGRDPLMHGPEFKAYYSDNKLSEHKTDTSIFHEILGLDV